VGDNIITIYKASCFGLPYNTQQAQQPSLLGQGGHYESKIIYRVNS
jgi:hypothetical protein